MMAAPVAAKDAQSEATRVEPDLWRLDSRARDTLRSLWPQTSTQLDGLFDEFYRMLAANPATAAFVQGRVPELKEYQRRRWQAFFEGSFGDDYLRQTVAMAEAHSRIGLEPRLFLSSYALIIERMVGIAVQRNRRNPDQAQYEAGVLIRSALMDAELALAIHTENAVSAQIMEEMQDFAEGFERELNEAVDYVRANAADMEGAADEVLNASNQVSKEGEHVTEASEQTNMNARLIALAANQQSGSFLEINAKVEQATATSRAASEKSQLAQDRAATLAAASERIGAVVKLIEKIAKETRLLALNATIEAARAGDAGRGFAVVAHEVKNLADQTNNATGDIRTQIEAMQVSIRETVDAIGEVAERVEIVADGITTIADAVTEQHVVTKDIASNAGDMAESMNSVHERISAVAEAAQRSTHQASELWENAMGLVRQIFGIKRRITSTLRGSRFGNRRHEERVAVDVACTCEVDGMVFHSRLDNINPHGVQIREMQLASADGYTIKLDIEGLGRATGMIVATDKEVAHVRFNPLPAETAGHLAQALARWKAQDLELVALAQGAARQVGYLFDEAIRHGEATFDDLFDAALHAIHGTDPQQYMTKYTELCDRILPPVQEPLLSAHPRVIFTVTVDRNGYLPTHNREYSQPQRPGDHDWNVWHSRNRRLFDDPTGLTAARSRQPYLVQTYRRDMGGGKVMVMKDVSAPILVRGKHWGGFRIGCKLA
ncbi:MAG TPA: methyl-accepting chemotaxis protein [Azospirillaceae bacterium]|nr:methyl-accepting chemotaxis protein [Azospirillaceae bacterium]